MQVTQTRADGLKREFQVVLPATELEERLTSELATLKDRVQLKGFRPGKVPVAHLRRIYGRSVMADVLQNAVNEANRKIVDENGLTLAMEPKVAFPEDKDEMAKAMDAKADLAFTVAVEVLPTFELADHADVSVTKPVAPVSDEQVDTTVERLARQNRTYTLKGEEAGPPRATASRSTMSGPSTASPSRAAAPRMASSRSARRRSSPGSRSSSSVPGLARPGPST